MVVTTDALLAEAADLLPEAVRLRRRLHRRPELGLCLPATQEAVLESLDDLPVNIRCGSAISSVIAMVEGTRSGPTVLLRADMDALPMSEESGVDFSSEVDGVMHACGHDAHVAMLAGAARLLCSRREDLAGRVLLMFQPGEEGYGGASLMLQEGLLDATTVGEVIGGFAIHQTPLLRSGVIATARAQ